MVGPRRQRHGAGVALLCAVLALGPWGADARRKLHQSDESGETGDAVTSSEMTAKHPPPPARPPAPGYPPHEEIPGTTLVVKMLDAYPEAVCNDGTSGGYYFSRGNDPSLWVVYLQGGASQLAAAWPNSHCVSTPPRCADWQARRERPCAARTQRRRHIVLRVKHPDAPPNPMPQDTGARTG